jgi:hypothetical protein
VSGPDGGLGNNGGDSGHPFERPRGPDPVQKRQKGQPQQQPGLAVITSHPLIVAQAARVCHYAPQARGPFTCMRGTALDRRGGLAVLGCLALGSAGESASELEALYPVAYVLQDILT